MSRALACLFALAAAAPALAQSAPAGPDAAAEQAAGAAATPRAAPPDSTGQADLDLLPAEPVRDAQALAHQAEVTRELALRRRMLQLHQLGGFVTLAGLAATTVIGQLDYADKYGGGGDTGRYIHAHAYAAFGTSAVFAATGLLAAFAPSPTEKPLRLDTGTLHKIAMGVATAGMIAEVVLGIWAAGKESSGQSPDLALTQRNLAVAHQVIGYTTLVATAAGFTVLAF